MLIINTLIITLVIIFFYLKLKKYKQVLSIHKVKYKCLHQELHSINQAFKESKEFNKRLLNNINHEVRTPINAISGFTQIIENFDLSDDKRIDFLKIIVNSSNQLLNIIDDILTISLIQSEQKKLTLKTINLRNELIKIYNNHQQDIELKEIKYELNFCLLEHQCIIESDIDKIEKILSIFLSNAIKFTQRRGYIELGCNLKDNYLFFYVSDNGIGIEEEMQKNIFIPFKQVFNLTNKYYGGLGLGLSIAKGYSDLLNGEILVKSKLNKGSCFYLKIPFYPVILYI